jgi:hypothetical protein
MMAETVTNYRPPVAKPISRPRSRRPATVSASALAQHLDCTRAYIGKLEADGVIQRQGDGYPLDQSRVAYLRYLRRERRQSPRSEADAAHIAVKTEMLRLQLMEKKRELLRREDSDEAMRQHRRDRHHASERHRGAPTIWRRGARSTRWFSRFARRWRKSPLRWPISMANRRSISRA